MWALTASTAQLVGRPQTRSQTRSRSRLSYPSPERSSRPRLCRLGVLDISGGGPKRSPQPSFRRPGIPDIPAAGRNALTAGAFDMICTSITADSVEGGLREIEAARAGGADLVELRLDFIKDFSVERDLLRLMGACDLPYIVTFRPAWEGGNFTGSETERLATLKLAAVLGAPYVDVELKAAKPFFASAREVKEGTKIILSHHNFEETPSQDILNSIVDDMWEAGADIAKLAVTANDITDCFAVLDLLKNKKGPTIALAMGERGQMTRLLAPKFGSFLTFGALATGSESAPGQVTLAQLRDVYRLPAQGPDTRVFGVIGNPVSHSRSPVLHNRCMAEVGFDGVYIPLLVDDLPSFLGGLDDLGFTGFSVTIPHKEEALRCASEVDDVAKQIGACNTLVALPDGSLRGSNTDWVGAISAIEQAMGGGGPDGISPLKGARVVVVGAGGAARAVVFGAASRGAEVVISNRSRERAEALAKSMPAGAFVEDLATLQGGGVSGDVLVNMTSVGMHPNEDETPVPKEALGQFGLVFDAVYTPMETRLLREAAEMGCGTISGVKMFVGQAAEQFQLFAQAPAPVDLMTQVVVDSLKT